MRGAALLALATALAAPAYAAQDEGWLTALRSGRYDEAIEVLENRLRRGAIAPAEIRGLVDGLRATGELERAEAAAARYAAAADGSAVAARRGLVARDRGELQAARQHFAGAVGAGAADALLAELELARLDFDTGRRAAAMRAFGRFIDYYNEGRARTSEELAAVGVACTYLGRDDPDLFHDAVRAFDEAIDADPSDPEPRLLLGELFLSKYDSSEAVGLIREALRLNPQHARAHLAEARRRRFDGEPEVMAGVDRALEINPALVEARVLRAELLIATEAFDAAAHEAEQALAVRPTALEALSMLAAARYLADDREGFDAAVEAAAALSPGYAGAYHTTAELAVQTRLYAEAVELAQRAVDIDPGLAAAHGTLGINLLRIGRIEEGRAHLETAFARDPFNVWYKNTLDLLDTFPEYRTVETEHFRLFIRRERADLVALYMGALAEEAYDRLTERYGFTPPDRVLIEVYDRHADFSVRTLGLAGLGALGVAFGPVVAVDAPAAAGMGEFNWGSTLWHEITHVMTLGATDNRVPRWLTEGLSVFEERRARTGWGDDVTPGFLIAYLQERLLPVSQINEGFVRPRYPQHVIHSYFQASLVCELITELGGARAVPAMLAAYRRGLRDEQVFRTVLGMEPEQIDRRFDEWLRARFATPLRALRTAAEAAAAEPSTERPSAAGLVAAADADREAFVTQLRAGAALVQQQRFADAVPYLERARALFPGYGGDDGPHAYLARAHRALGDVDAAVAELEAWASINENSMQAHLELAELQASRGATREAAWALERTVYIDPWDIGRHQQLAELRERLGEWPSAVRERAAVVALDPPDPAEAWYRLAWAQHRSGDLRAARRAVLSALEIAPSYEPAQALLLEIRGRGSD